MSAFKSLSALFFLIFLCHPAWSTVTINQISGASLATINNSGTSEIMGGTAGLDCASGNTCDSCDGSADTACNEARINDSGGQLTIRFTLSDSDGGTAFVGNSTERNDLNVFNDVIVSDGQTVSLSANWSTLCGHISGGTTDCDLVDDTGTFTIGVDTNSDNVLDDYLTFTVTIASNTTPTTVDSSSSDGIDGYEIFPGDEKVYLINLQAIDNFPTYSGGVANFAKIRVFFEEVNPADDCSTAWGSIVNTSSYFETDIEEISGTDDVEPAEDYFTGFINRQRYAFKLALVDEAGNISWFLDSLNCDEGIHFVTPDEVFGVLDEGANCFVTTAAYGSPLASKVQTFRRFRDEILKQTLVGRKFIQMYYDHSPYLAVKIQDSPFLKFMSQVVLFPIWGLAAVVLEGGMMILLFSAISFLVLLFIMRKRARHA